jgi:hypothetical protein
MSSRIGLMIRLRFALLVEEFAYAVLGIFATVQVVTEELAGRPAGALGRALARPLRQHLGVDAHLEGVGQQFLYVFAQAHPGLLAHQDPQPGLRQVHRGELFERAPHRPQGDRRGDRHVADPGGLVDADVDDRDRGDVLLLAEVDRERRAAVAGGAGGDDLLGAVQVAERHVVGVAREDRGGHGVAHDRVCLALAAAGRGADHGQVGREQVDDAGLVELVAEPLDQPGDVVGVGLGRLGGGQLVHLGGADRVALGEERQRDELPPLAVGRLAGDQQLVGLVAHGAAHHDPRGLGPRPQRVEGGPVVVVAADRDHLRAG